MADQMNEGSLDILWGTRENPGATPIYRTIFTSYRTFKGGAVQSKSIVGDKALEAYLLWLNFSSDDIEGLLRKVKDDGETRADNVMLTVEQVAEYSHNQR